MTSKKNFDNKKWIFLNKVGGSEGVYYFHDIVGLIPNLDKHNCTAGYAYYPIDLNCVSASACKFEGFCGAVPNSKELQKIFNDNINYFREPDGYIRVCGNKNPGATYRSGGWRYMWTANNNKYKMSGYNGSDIYYFWVIPIFRFGGANANASTFTAWQVIRFWLQNNLYPNDDVFFSDVAKKFFNMIKANDKSLTITAEGVTLNREGIFKAVKSGQTFDFLPSVKKY